MPLKPQQNKVVKFLIPSLFFILGLFNIVENLPDRASWGHHSLPSGRVPGIVYMIVGVGLFYYGYKHDPEDDA